jgi:hypothetical protein
MTPEEMKAFLDAIEGLRSDVTDQISALDKKYGAVADAVATLQKKSDEAGVRQKGLKADGDDDDGRPSGLAGDDRLTARRVAADHVDPAAFAALSSSVAELRKKQSRPMAGLDAFADAQAKADAVMIANGERAEPPMAGEDLVNYQIRMHRKMQAHSAKWKGVDLSLIAADRAALNNVLAEIRADALQAGLNPVGLPLFQHREIVQESPGGHKIRSFVGNGTIFKQMSRPVRHVAFIGTRSGAAHY